MRKVLQSSVVGIHVMGVLGAILVPLYALFGAGLALFDSGAGPGAVLPDPGRWWVLLSNTLVVCGTCLAVTLPVGSALGLLVARTDLPARWLVLGSASLLACVPPFVHTTFVISAIPAWKYAQSAVACGVVYGLIYTPLATLGLAAVFRASDPDLEDAALLDVSAPAVIRHVTIPQSAWGLFAVGVLVLLLVMTDYLVADLFRVRTFAEEVYTQYALNRSAAGPVLTALPSLVLLAALVAAVRRRCRRLGERSPDNAGAAPRTFQLGGWRIVIALALAMVTLSVIAWPAASLLRKVGSPRAFLDAAAHLREELVVSSLLAIGGATLVVALAVGLAWSALRNKLGRRALPATIVLLLALPAPVVGISLIELLNRPGWTGWLYDSPLIIVAGYFVRFLPFAILLLLPAVQRVPLDLEPAARIDGCDWLATQRQVYWPAVSRDALIVWLVIVILCFAEIGCTMLVAPPGWTTASVRAFTLMHFGVYRDLAVLALTSIACMLTPWLLLVALLRRKYAV